MTDSQNKTVWNDWANYVLSVIKKHDNDIEKSRLDLTNNEIEINRLKETKVDQKDFNKFMSEDYVVFKTTVLTKAKVHGAIWGIIGTILASIIISVIKGLLESM